MSEKVELARRVVLSLADEGRIELWGGQSPEGPLERLSETQAERLKIDEAPWHDPETTTLKVKIVSPAVYENPSGVAFGCDYCADYQNRNFGHVTQIGWNERRRMILIRCPRCGAMYENTPEEEDLTRRLDETEARNLYPDTFRTR